MRRGIAHSHDPIPTCVSLGIGTIGSKAGQNRPVGFTAH